MAGKIIIDTERCKGCGLCVAVCPKNNIHISEESNKSGYFPAQCGDGNCTGCAMCAIICPEAVIEVSIENKIAEIENKAKNRKAPLSKEEAK